MFILTHGSDSGKIFGTDQDILISKLMEPVKNNLLAGKPKMVFVQVCCQGTNKAVVTQLHAQPKLAGQNVDGLFMN